MSIFTKGNKPKNKEEAYITGVLEGERMAKDMIRGEWAKIRPELIRQWLPQDPLDALHEIDLYLEEE